MDHFIRNMSLTWNSATSRCDPPSNHGHSDCHLKDVKVCESAMPLKWAGSIVSLWLSKMSANERKPCTCEDFHHWLRPRYTITKKTIYGCLLSSSDTLLCFRRKTDIKLCVLDLAVPIVLFYLSWNDLGGHRINASLLGVNLEEETEIVCEHDRHVSGTWASNNVPQYSVGFD